MFKEWKIKHLWKRATFKHRQWILTEEGVPDAARLMKIFFPFGRELISDCESEAHEETSIQQQRSPELSHKVLQMWPADSYNHSWMLTLRIVMNINNVAAQGLLPWWPLPAPEPSMQPLSVPVDPLETWGRHSCLTAGLKLAERSAVVFIPPEDKLLGLIYIFKPPKKH